GTFKVAMVGNVAQTISFNYAGGSNSSPFTDLEIANTNGGVTFINAAYTQGNLNITTPTTVGGPGPLTVVGDLNCVSGSTFSVTTVTIGGNRIGAGTYTSTNTTFTGNITLQEP